MNFDFHIITHALGWALIHFLWQGLAIALATAFLLQISRNARAQIRYLIACFSLLACFLVPIWEVLTSSQTTAEFIGVQVIPSTFAEAKTALGWIEQAQIWFQLHIDLIVIVWATVVAMLGLRLLLGVLWLRTYSNGERGVSNAYWQRKTDQLAAHFQIAKPVLVRIVEELDSPITIGWIRPMILIPASLITGMTPSYLEALIAHELAHISRFDYLVNFIQNLIEMVLFFHPAVWWISKRIRIERENIADDLAASMLGEPRRLALALQELEYLQFTTPQLAQAAHGGNLMLRIKRLVRPEAQSISWKTAVTAIGIASASVGLAANAAMPLWIQTDRLDLHDNVETVIGGVSEHSMNSIKSKESKDNETKSTLEAKLSTAKDIIVHPRIDFARTGCAPEYPAAAMRSELEGTTRLAILLSDKGIIENVNVEKSSGHSILDDALKNQLLSGKCTGLPGSLNGKPHSARTLVDYVWKLDEWPVKNEKPYKNRQANLDHVATVDFVKTGCSPEYPKVSVRNSEHGTTVLAVNVSDSGAIDDVKIFASSGFRGLDQAVASKLRSGTCKANPAKMDGKNVASVINVKYVWKLN
ncbi:TonB family protein [Undibacterium macrobrachii]|uniref:TonB C-terminal domain-containing protein n=1 Tax=Undibacterium macrobrachii TaxID=1119058 RepID=A0ABQ2X4W2_9BURK|nr:TonB family protein [Undibacterium macrobrachii]GGW99328.1 hypothetical protein GCM10011282_01400 [Undibacterium macrobrachii]